MVSKHRTENLAICFCITQDEVNNTFQHGPSKTIHNSSYLCLHLGPDMGCICTQEDVVELHSYSPIGQPDHSHALMLSPSSTLLKARKQFALFYTCNLCEPVWIQPINNFNKCYIKSQSHMKRWMLIHAKQKKRMNEYSYRRIVPNPYTFVTITNFKRQSRSCRHIRRCMRKTFFAPWDSSSISAKQRASPGEVRTAQPSDAAGKRCKYLMPDARQGRTPYTYNESPPYCTNSWAPRLFMWTLFKHSKTHEFAAQVPQGTLLKNGFHPGQSKSAHVNVIMPMIVRGLYLMSTQLMAVHIQLYRQCRNLKQIAPKQENHRMHYVHARSTKRRFV